MRNKISLEEVLPHSADNLYDFFLGRPKDIEGPTFNSGIRI